MYATYVIKKIEKERENGFAFKLQVMLMLLVFFSFFPTFHSDKRTGKNKVCEVAGLFLSEFLLLPFSSVLIYLQCHRHKYTI